MVEPQHPVGIVYEEVDADLLTLPKAPGSAPAKPHKARHSDRSPLTQNKALRSSFQKPRAISPASLRTATANMLFKRTYAQREDSIRRAHTVASNSQQQKKQNQPQQAAKSAKRKTRLFVRSDSMPTLGGKDFSDSEEDDLLLVAAAAGDRDYFTEGESSFSTPPRVGLRRQRSSSFTEGINAMARMHSRDADVQRGIEAAFSGSSYGSTTIGDLLESVGMLGREDAADREDVPTPPSPPSHKSHKRSPSHFFLDEDSSVSSLVLRPSKSGDNTGTEGAIAEGEEEVEESESSVRSIKIPSILEITAGFTTSMQDSAAAANGPKKESQSNENSIRKKKTRKTKKGSNTSTRGSDPGLSEPKKENKTKKEKNLPSAEEPTVLEVKKKTKTKEKTEAAKKRPVIKQENSMNETMLKAALEAGSEHSDSLSSYASLPQNLKVKSGRKGAKSEEAHVWEQGNASLPTGLDMGSKEKRRTKVKLQRESSLNETTLKAAMEAARVKKKKPKSKEANFLKQGHSSLPNDLSIVPAEEATSADSEDVSFWAQGNMSVSTVSASESKKKQKPDPARKARERRNSDSAANKIARVPKAAAAKQAKAAGTGEQDDLAKKKLLAPASTTPGEADKQKTREERKAKAKKKRIAQEPGKAREAKASGAETARRDPQTLEKKGGVPDLGDSSHSAPASSTDENQSLAALSMHGVSKDAAPDGKSLDATWDELQNLIQRLNTEDAAQSEQGSESNPWNKEGKQNPWSAKPRSNDATVTPERKKKPKPKRAAGPSHRVDESSGDLRTRMKRSTSVPRWMRESSGDEGLRQEDRQDTGPAARSNNRPAAKVKRERQDPSPPGSVVAKEPKSQQPHPSSPTGKSRKGPSALSLQLAYNSDPTGKHRYRQKVRGTSRRIQAIAPPPFHVPSVKSS